MDMLSIVIDLKDEKLASRLAKALASSSDKLDVGFKSKERKTGDLVISQKMEEDILPISGLMKIISDTYMKKTGKPLYSLKKGFRKLYSFTSPTGGSGLTSAAFVFSRLLAGKMNEKVLFIDVGRKGSFTSEESEISPLRNSRELEYLIKKGMKYSLEEHLTKDYYGVWVLKLEAMDEEIFRSIDSRGGFDTIVVAGAPEVIITEGIRIVILNSKDARSLDAYYGEEGSIVVRNREYINHISEDRVLIAEDGLSFKNPGSGVVISMDGDFAIGVDKLMRKAVSEYNYG